MLVDSNILVYSINSSSPKNKRAQKFILENINDLEVAHQNIFESLRVLTHPKFPSPMKITSAIEAVESILKGLKIIAPSYRTHHIALALITKHKLSSDQIFDAYLAVTALDNGIYKIATDNVNDFKRFTNIKLVNPFA